MTIPDDPRGPVPDADPLDEVATAVVDGEATDEERARVSDDPALAARVAAFEAVAELVATPVAPLPDDRREAAIAAAAAPPVTGDNVVPLRRPPFWQRTWLPAAAAIAVVVGGLGLLVAALGSAGDDADQATAAGDAATEATVLAERDIEEGAAAPATTAAQFPGAGSAGGAAADSAVESAAPPADLGEFPDLAALEAALAEDDEDDALSEEAAASFAPAPCSERFGSSLERVVTARVGGTPVTVGVYLIDGARSYEMYDQATCEPLAGGNL